jgi:hypothetical protein
MAEADKAVPPDPLVTLAPGTEDAGLAMMLAGLIRQNLEQNPDRKADFDRLDLCISIEAVDAEVVVTLEFGRGTLVVYAGTWGSPSVRLSADSQTVIELSTLRIIWGIPNLLDPVGRRLAAKLLSGKVRITGILRHASGLLRLTRLLSVYG